MTTTYDASGRRHSSHDTATKDAPAASSRTVPQVHPDEAIGAAYYLEREYGPGRTLGFAGRWTDGSGRSWAVWQCAAGDGSRWLIRSDRYGNVGYFETTLEVEVAAMLDVEVSAR